MSLIMWGPSETHLFQNPNVIIFPLKRERWVHVAPRLYIGGRATYTGQIVFIISIHLKLYNGLYRKSSFVMKYWLLISVPMSFPAQKKKVGKASFLIIIHISSLGNVQLACHVSITCTIGTYMDLLVNNLKNLWT